ncbi:MAG: tRNA (adenosine(37)-N6)-threonylcarbamoyltransferase complex transferase subunit TsaD [Spirochaetota bacterium]|nr:tRNA (adenosine(37)-N6)-threonylcarbamoyltransferase complex transferase subunit TsaD [Spirochaetota bacterium]
MSDKSDIIGLGLESSCDETSASVVKNGEEILSNITFSQIDIHQEYSGVVPEIASRAHIEVINGLISKALDRAGVGFRSLDYVAATNRPGLVGSLLIALQSAKAISYSLNIPLICINHLEAHLYAPFLEAQMLFFPYIGLVVSGGNTVLYHVQGIGRLEIIGKTVDDAVGEAFDKVAKFLELGYPGGPIIEKMAKLATERRMIFPKILADNNDDFRFSYSGIKTAVINYVKKNPDMDTREIAYSFQERSLEILIRRVLAAARLYKIKDIVVTGGVASNGRLREMLMEGMRDDERLLIPSPILCTDNAAMVGGLGFQYYRKNIFSDLSIDVAPRA